MKAIDRRQFIKCCFGGSCALVLTSGMPWLLKDQACAQAVGTTLNFTITDALKDMATHNLINQAQCYFWVFKEASLPAEVPGPHIFVTQGDTVQISVTNALDEPHAWSVPALEFTTGPIAPGATVSTQFTVAKAGTFLYYDDLNEPVNRMMGLHGAFIAMPAQPAAGHRFTPYDSPTPAVQRLFDDLGSTPWWPGLAWEEGDPATNTQPFRQYIWLLHQPSPNLFAEVGDFTPGQDYPADQFVQKFLHDPFSPVRANNIPQYFTITGQSGHFSHNNPYINPNRRVGEPVLIRILNAGLWTHSMHIHANHIFLIGVNNAALSAINPPGGGGGNGGGDGNGGGGSAGGSGGGGSGCFISTLALGGNQNVFSLSDPGPQGNLLWIDVFTVNPLDVVDWVAPYMRPPDIPNRRGIGRADTGLATALGSTWPPNEEIATQLPSELQLPGLSVGLSPLCYPMHDHSEPSQTSQGGNYNMGMIAGMNFIGDRNTAGGVTSFPNQPLVFPPGPRGVFPPTVQPPYYED